jgi:diaminopimelate epimerase
MRFDKFQALGNDFLLLDGDRLDHSTDWGAVARLLCDRHYGAGADGIVVVFSEGGQADWRTRIFNADGGEAEVSGNGTRCVAAWLALNGRWSAGQEWLTVSTLAGNKRVRRVGELYEMEVGVPRLAAREIPFADRMDRVIRYPLDLDGTRLEITATSMGNPHCSVFVEDVESVDLRGLGSRLETHPLFPERTNVEFIQPVSNDHVRVAFWERGVGETQSSGTGASAACVASVLNDLTARRVRVETPAGDLEVEWRDTDDVVLLTGPAVPVYEGRLIV